MAKKLLNESTVRRFQRLANVKPLKEMYHMRDEDEKMMEAEEMEMDAEAPAEMDMKMDAEEAPEMEGAAEELELTDEEAQSIIDLGKKLEAAMGEKEEEGEEAEEMEMGAEEEGEEEMGEKEMMEALQGISYVPTNAEVVNEVAKRVAKRLAEAQKAEKRMNEALGRSTKRK